MSTNIATLIKDGKTLATLNKSGEWESEARYLTWYLKLHFDPNRDTGVGAVLPFGHYAASRAAEQLGAEVKYEQSMEPLPEELVS